MNSRLYQPSLSHHKSIEGPRFKQEDSFENTGPKNQNFKYQVVKRKQQEDSVNKISKIYNQNPYKMSYQISPKLKALKQASQPKNLATMSRDQSIAKMNLQHKHNHSISMEPSVNSFNLKN